VTQHEKGQVDPTDGSSGPHGDWYSFGKPTGEQQWPVQSFSTMVQIYHNQEDPTDIQVIQLENNKHTKWAELPNCRGDSGEISLEADLSNATLASCKSTKLEYIAAPSKDD